MHFHACNNIYLLALIFLYFVGCTSHEPHTKGPMPQDKQDSKQLSIRELWETQSKELDHVELGKGYPAKKLELLNSILDKAPAEQVKSEFTRIHGDRTGFEHMSEYDQTLLQAFVERAINRKDKEKLIYLLSANCPPAIASASLELYLAQSDLPDPLIVLFDSFEKATNETAKRALFKILTHAFKPLRSKDMGEQDFLKASRDWYLKTGSRLKINPYYHPYGIDPLTRELFIQD